MEGLWLCALLLLTTAHAASLNLEEGEVCKEVDGVNWTCTRLTSCPTAKAGIEKRLPGMCNTNDTHIMVCCEPTTSEKMCVKYSKNIIVEELDPFDGKILRRDTCKAVEPLIVGGVAAVPREFPHMALVGTEHEGTKHWVCGGSLVSQRFVLSAAHCTNVSSVVKWVRLGEFDKNSDEDERKGYSTPMDLKIIEIFDHPDYKKPMEYNDIALYKLEREVRITEYIRPICLDTDNHVTDTGPYKIATGWGYVNYKSGSSSDILLKVNLTVTPWQNCSVAYKQFTAGLPDGIRNESMICAADFSTDDIKETCKGDSGGPLQVRRKTPYCMYSQVGITSLGINCGYIVPREAGVYTRVAYFVPWIESIVWPNDV